MNLVTRRTAQYLIVSVGILPEGLDIRVQVLAVQILNRSSSSLTRLSLEEVAYFDFRSPMIALAKHDAHLDRQPNELPDLRKNKIEKKLSHGQPTCFLRLQ